MPPWQVACRGVSPANAQASMVLMRLVGFKQSTVHLPLPAHWITGTLVVNVLVPPLALHSPTASSVPPFLPSRNKHMEWPCHPTTSYYHQLYEKLVVLRLVAAKEDFCQRCPAVKQYVWSGYFCQIGFLKLFTKVASSSRWIKVMIVQTWMGWKTFGPATEEN